MAWYGRDNMEPSIWQRCRKLEDKFECQFKIKEDPYVLMMTLCQLEEVYKQIMEPTKRLMFQWDYDKIKTQNP